MPDTAIQAACQRVAQLTPFSQGARPGRKNVARQISPLLEQMLGVDITKLSNWIGVLDNDEMDALDDALRLYHGLL